MAESSTHNIALAMIALEAPRAITTAQAAAAYRKLWPDDGKPTNPIDDGSSFSFETEHAMVAFGHMDTPIPGDDIEDAAGLSILWPEAAAKSAGHKAHFVVTAISNNRPPTDGMVTLTKAIAAILPLCKPAAIYWGAARMLIDPEEFATAARESLADDVRPVHLWINIVPMEVSRGRTSMATIGMESFGQMELEVVDSKHDVPEVGGFLGSIASYLIENGPVLKHGETIGFSPDQKVKAEHTASAFREDGTKVIRLRF